MNNNIAIYNDQKLDTWSDIVVSFEYERFAINETPTGGFALVFFDSIVDLPRGGGPGYSLGYLPNSSKEYCKMGGFPGLQAAFLGIGFDNKGFFASTQDSVNGLPLPSLSAGQSITVRGGVAENYDILKIVSLNNILSSYQNATTFTVDQSANSSTTIARRSVRVMLKNNATKLLVQIKDNVEREEFDTILEMSLAEKKRTSLKVALTNTSDNLITNFKNLNYNSKEYNEILKELIESEKTDELQQSDILKKQSKKIENILSSSSNDEKLVPIRSIINVLQSEPGLESLRENTTLDGKKRSRKMSKKRSRKISKKMSKKMSRKISKKMSKKISKKMSKKMSRK
ncbi:hypothetical protein EBS02_10850, partial [bacterium]|nr:hypothetical protein [bacterium]